MITSGTSVDTWKDLYRNGRDVTAISTKPTVVQNVLNGFPCVRFNSSPMDSSQTIPAGSTYSILALVKDNNTGTNISEPFSIGTSSSGTSVEFVLDYNGSVTANTFCFFNAGAKANAARNFTTSPALLAIGLSAGVSKARANGVTAANVSSGLSTTSAVFRVGGSRPQSPANPYPLNGDIYCLLIIASPIDSHDYLKAEAWIAWNYNAPYLLGAGHRYRLRPPLIGD